MSTPQDIERLQSQMKDTVKAHWKAFLIEGIVLVILGMAAIAIPQLASVAVAIMLGWMFLISGALGLYFSFTTRDMPGFWWSLLSAVLALAAGLLLLAQPLQRVEHARASLLRARRRVGLRRRRGRGVRAGRPPRARWPTAHQHLRRTPVRELHAGLGNQCRGRPAATR